MAAARLESAGSIEAIATAHGAAADRALVARVHSNLLEFRTAGGVIVTYWDAAYPELLRHIARPPVVLYVGSIFNRRHVPDLIRAFASVLSHVPDARLEIVGDNRTRPREDLNGLASSLDASDRVMLRSYVPDAELASLYAQARVFAFLSEYEGFGFTPLEALAHSVPIVVLDTPVAREVYGGAALYVAAGDLPATANALTRLLLDPALRAAQLRHAQAVLARYCWPDAARLTLQAIEQAGARG